jgi:hypothetical protein
MPANKRAKRATKKKATSAKPPWKRAAPKKSSHKKLSPAQKRSAKSAAKHAGRPYPNLVDNMRAASKKRSRKQKS